MKTYMYNPKVQILLLNQTNEKVYVMYNNNLKPFEMPKIGPRPPFYTNPRYEPYFTII